MAARSAESEKMDRLREWLRAHRSRKTALRGAAAGLVVVLVAMVFVAASPPAAPRSTASGAPAPTAAQDDGQPAAASPAAEWAALELAPYQPVAVLVADVVDGTGVAPDATFTFRSLTSAPAVELTAGLTVEPAVELEIEAGPSPDVATVRPADPLAANASYRFRLSGPDGALAGEWLFRVGGPLHVVRRLPDDRATQVPVDTGIEVEFDQDDLVGVAERFSIEPSVEGRFEEHGRTWVFVPARQLEPATLYTVTLGAGVGITDSEHVLESEVRFAFETAAADATVPARVVFERPLHEVRPDEAPVIPVLIGGDPGEGSTLERQVVVYALDTLDAAVDAASTLAVDRDWAWLSSNGNVSTDALAQVGTFDVTVSVAWPDQHFTLPTGLPAGWYLLEVAQDGRDAQAVLQVSDLAAYVLASDSRTVAWVNDLAADAPVPNASIALADGTPLAPTDAAGLADFATPAQLTGVETGAGIVVIAAPDGRRLVTPLFSEGSSYYGPAASASAWWLLFGTDRLQYRADDTIRVWGLVRSRADRSVPGGLELRLVAGDEADAPPILRTAVTATERGVVLGELPVRDLPLGQYRVGLYLAGEAIAEVRVSVTDIRKPAFRMEIETDRRAYLVGDPVHLRATAAFYDGSAAPGLTIRLDGTPLANGQELKAGPAGLAELTVQATRSGEISMEHASITAAPAHPEEGSSYATTSYIVFGSEAWLDADATLADGTLAIEGRLTSIDFDAAESQLAAAGWVEDPSGAPLAGREVLAEVDRVTWRAVQIGTTYDFLQKKTVPTHNYEREVQPVGTFTAVSDGNGAFTITLPDDGPGSLEVRLTAVDDGGREVALRLFPSSSVPPIDSTFPYLEQPAGCALFSGRTASLNEAVTFTVRSGAGEPSADGRTLFLVGSLGIDDVSVTTGATIEQVLEEADLPSITVRAVRFSPAGYVVMNDARLGVDRASKAIEVVLDTDRARYVPGDVAAVGITTLGPNGQPIAADVVLQAIDAKLYAIGAARPVDTAALMAPVAAGFTASYASHRVPPPPFATGCGATTGGGERQDFEDVATYQLVSTDAGGRGSATFEVPDDLTSWVLTGTAFGGELESGSSSVEIPVGLPFFVDATLAPEYLEGDAPIIQLRAFGDALGAGEAVLFTLDSASLGLSETTVEGTAFDPVHAALPALPLGSHELTIRAERVGGTEELADAVVRTIRVVSTRLRTLQTSHDVPDGALTPDGGSGLTSYVVTDAGRGALVPVLEQLAWNGSARFDAALAADVAAELLVEEFGRPEASVPASGFVGGAGHPPEGLALLPYASADLFLTSRAALVAPDRISVQHAGDALRMELDSNPSRERRIVALSGLAGLGEDVLAELRAENVPELTVRERLWLALGLAAAGDEEAARAIEHSVLSEHGRRLDRWVRLEGVPSTPEGAEATASMLLLASRLRDPIALDISRYLLENASDEYLPVLEQLGFVRSAIGWLPRPEARFAWTLDGTRHEEILERGEAFSLTLTPAQRASLVIEPIDGAIAVTGSWAGDAGDNDLPADPLVRVERIVSPADHAPAGDIVRVTLNVSFETNAPAGCYQVTDLLPSGLAPMTTAMYGYDSATFAPGVILPYEVEGQRVSWCVDPRHTDGPLGYSARVVSAGTYRWEAAVVQSLAAPSVGSATTVTSYTIDH